MPQASGNWNTPKCGGFNNYWLPKKKFQIFMMFSFHIKLKWISVSVSTPHPPPARFFFFFSPSQEARGPRHRAAYTAILCFRPGTFPASVTEFNLRETTEVPPSGIHTALVLRAGGKRRQILYTKRGPHD